MKINFLILLLLISFFCSAQEATKKTKAYKSLAEYKGTNPYKGKPFKPNEIRTVLLNIPVGNITVSNYITYRLLPDEEGKSYRAHHTYGAYIIKVTPTGRDTGAIPQSLTQGFLYRVIDLTEQQIMSIQITTSIMDYFFAVDDFNLDGTPDFSFTGDKQYHSYPIKNYVWVNINGKLAYWHNMSNVSSDKEDKRTRMVSIIVTTKNGSYIPQYYHIKKDTTLVLFKY